MAIVFFSSELQQFTGEERAEVSALNYRDLISELAGRYELLSREKLSDMAVAIDGVIIADPLLETVGPETEIHFLHFISGG